MGFGILSGMTKLLQDTIEKLKELPDERQDELAHALIAVAESDLHPYRLTDEQVDEVERRRNRKNPKTLTLAQLDARFKHLGA
jgi:hypothetical protein